MFKPLNPLYKSPFTPYPMTEFRNELFIDEQVAALFAKVGEITDLTNELIDYLNKFAEEFDVKLYDTVEKVLLKWLEDGKFDDIVSRLIVKLGDFSSFRPWDETIIEKMSNEFRERCVNPKWYGAKVDNVTDDSEVVETVLNSYPDVNFLNKTYLLKKNISLTSGVDVMNIVNGHFIGRKDDCKPTIITINRNNVNIENCIFENVVIVYGDVTATTKYENINILNNTFLIDDADQFPLDLKTVKNVVIEKNKFTFMGTNRSNCSALRLHNDKNDSVTNPSENVRVSLNEIDGFWRGIDCYGTGYRSNFLFEKNKISNCTLHGIFLYHCEGGRVVLNSVVNCGYGIWFDGGALGTKFLPQICSMNSLNDIYTGYGIYAEETHGAIFDSNNLRNVVGIGIVLSAGNEYSKVINNIIRGCEYGIAIDYTFAPSQIQTYFNSDNTIQGNTIENARLDGIFIRSHYRSLKITDNLIVSCNLANQKFVFAINIERSDSTDIANNTLNNYANASTTMGHQGGISVGFKYTEDRSTAETSYDIGKLNLQQNTGVGLENNHLRTANTGVSQGVNTAGILTGNSFMGTGETYIRYPNTFVIIGNMGIGEYSPYISNSGDKIMKLTKGVTALPTPTVEYEGCITKIARTTEKATSYYICKQLPSGSYGWVEIFI